jgi:hypothetical protein
MKFRQHRGSLDESMGTLVELADYGALVSHIRGLLRPHGVAVEDNDVRVDLYDNRPDPRIGWERTYVVVVSNYGVIGMTDTNPGVFECPRCHRVSYNPYDKINGYCGRCHEFTGRPNG